MPHGSPFGEWEFLAGLRQLMSRFTPADRRSNFRWRGNGLQFGVSPTNAYLYGLLLICERGPQASATSTRRPLPPPETKARQRPRQQRRRRLELESNAARCPCAAITSAALHARVASTSSVVNDPSRKQGVHRNNRRTCRVFRGIQWRRSCRKICRHKATYLLGHSLSVDARQETDMPLLAFPA